MVTHGAALRAIPEKVTEIYEVRHRDQYPDAKIVYLEDFKREMLVNERRPINAGKFILETGLGTLSKIDFSARQFYDSITQAVEDLLDKSKSQ